MSAGEANSSLAPPVQNGAGQGSTDVAAFAAFSRRALLIDIAGPVPGRAASYVADSFIGACDVVLSVLEVW